MPAAADDDHIVVALRPGIAPGRRPARMCRVSAFQTSEKAEYFIAFAGDPIAQLLRA